MIALGKFNKLRVIKHVVFGLYLQGDGSDEILLPRHYMPDNVKVDDELDVFIYTDSEDRIIATTLHPMAQVGEVAYLRVKAIESFGAFLDWGLLKDLFVPFREQMLKMQEGKKYLVYVYVDEETNRIAASSHLNRFIKNDHLTVEQGDEVELTVADSILIGTKVVINNLHWGMLYNNEIFQPLHIGQKITGFIKKIREDGKIDVSLQRQGYDEVETASNKILQKMMLQNGQLFVNDDSTPEAIKTELQMSKKLFKKAVGALYKQQKIEFTQNGIKLL